MNPMAGNPYAQYQAAQLETAPPERLLLMLFDAAIRFAGQARQAMVDKRIEESHKNCVRVQNILTELMTTLRFDVGGDVARNLFDLYEFLHHTTIQANVKKDPGQMDLVIGHLKDLREAWGQAARNVASQRTRTATA
ncbi:MAG: flagellar export chaperone FliS [Candidatus Sericytochromatia bacterium]|nr:flagellar export chaperone FliS [Candidatus Sericytochromatia bacterium]